MGFHRQRTKKTPAPSVIRPSIVVAIYVLLSWLWIYFSNRALAAFHFAPEITTLLDTAKGTLYIVWSAAIIYILLAQLKEARDDMEERLLQEQKLLEATEELKKRFRVLADTAPVLIWMSNGGEKREFFNHAWLEFTGRSLEQEVGDGWAEGIHAADQKHCLEIYKFASRQRLPFRMEYRLRRHDGAYHWMVDTGVPRYSESEEFAGYIGTCTDISSVKRAEQEMASVNQKLSELVDEKTAELTEANERLQRIASIVEHSHDAIIGTTGYGIITSWNRGAERIYGYTAEEMLGRHINILAPEDKKQEPATFISSVIGGQDIVEIQVVRQHKSGKKVDIALTVSGVRGPDGTMIGVSSIGRDITERRRSEQLLAKSEREYRALFDNAPLGIARTDFSTRFQRANRALVEMLGYGSEEEVAQLDVAKDVYRDENDRAKVLDMVRATNGPVHDMKVEWKKKNGSPLQIRMCGHGFGDGNFELLVEDVTEQQKLEKQLLHAQKMEAVGQLAGGVAHDFNNLLMVIQGNVEMLDMMLQQPGMEKELERLQTIRQAAESATSVTTQLLAFSRKQVLKPEPTDLNKLIERIGDMLRRLIGENIKLEVLTKGGLGRVAVDRGRIEEAVINLAVNSRDAMPNGGRLTIETDTAIVTEKYAAIRGEIAPGAYSVIAVSDTGTGIDKLSLPHIFEPFFTTKEMGKGTGLGLSTVYGIVRQSNGAISVYSEPDKGTVFKIYLPQIDTAPEQARQEEASMSRRMAGVPGKILVVEDEDALREILAEYLRMSGYETYTAANCKEALAIAEEAGNQIALLITDVILPDMTGKQLAAVMIEKCPSLKIIYSSGYTANSIVHHGVLDTNINFLQKPYTRTMLLEKIDEIFR